MTTKSKSVKYCSPAGSLETPYDLAIVKEFHPLFSKNEVRHQANLSSIHQQKNLLASENSDLQLDYSLHNKESILSYDTKHNFLIISLYVFLMSALFLVSGVILSGVGSLLNNPYLLSGANLCKAIATLPLALFVLRHVIEVLDIVALRTFNKKVVHIE